MTHSIAAGMHLLLINLCIKSHHQQSIRRGQALTVTNGPPEAQMQMVTRACAAQDYWSGPQDKYRFVPVLEFEEAFRNSPVGKANAERLQKPYEKSDVSDKALVRQRYALTRQRPPLLSMRQPAKVVWSSVSV